MADPLDDYYEFGTEEVSAVTTPEEDRDDERRDRNGTPAPAPAASSDVAMRIAQAAAAAQDETEQKPVPPPEPHPAQEAEAEPEPEPGPEPATSHAQDEPEVQPEQDDPPDIQRSPDSQVDTRLFVAIRTIPDFDRLDLFGLDCVKPLPPETPLDKLGPPGQIINYTSTDACQFISAINPPEDWLVNAIAAEEGRRLGPRKTIITKLNTKLTGLQRSHASLYKRLENLSETPEFCMICTASVAFGGDRIHTFVVGEPGPGGHVLTEQMIVALLWKWIEMCGKLVVWDPIIRHVLMTRTVLLNLKGSRALHMGECVEALRQGVSPASAAPKNLDRVAALYRLESTPLLRETMADVWGRGDKEDVASDCAAEVRMLRDLWLKWEGCYV